ncbi:anaerobic carbon-monoxide dehydrogenase catalytic subunit [candidate division KSB1 bacterium]|nr:anaerobic carbon-monoxide dehydrogenase catalytic subunit [candidate division KSB1 bacterium]
MEKSIDPAVNELLKKSNGASTVWQRAEAMLPQCGFGELGVCCRICFMGPCRIDPFGEGPQVGVCGATAQVIAARNFARMIAGGAAAHSDHGRDVANALLTAVENPDAGYRIKDTAKLYKVAGYFNIDLKNKKVNDIARETAIAALAEFGQQTGPLRFIQRAPQARREIWQRLGITPRGIDREIVEIMHRTTMGVDQEHTNIMLQGMRASLADGWGGSMVATELQDILFGTPSPIRGQVNLGVLSENEVNIVVHGHEPVLSEMIVLAARDEEMLALARSKGAAGINLTGICCTANEILLRHGIAVAGNFLQQELAVATGAVDAMIVDVQCIMASLGEFCRHYHTKLVTTSPKAKMDGVTHIEFTEHEALEKAKEIVKIAIENFPNRGAVDIPKHKMDLVAGFSHEAILYMLGGSFRGSYTPLNDNIINGRIKGVAGVVGCNNPKTPHDVAHVELVKELIANDILVVQTGCSGIACAKSGLMTPEAAVQFAGPGLKQVCETVGMPPVLHSGSCVDNSRILVALSEMVTTGGLGNDISDLPVAGAAPEWMSEKAISIGQYFVASGVFTVFGVGLPVFGSPVFRDYLFKDLEKLVGGSWAMEKTPAEMAARMIDHIRKKREKLGISKAKERVLYDMEMRRELVV